MARLATYRSSGRTTIRFVGLSVAAVGLAVVAAWPYQAAIQWVPFVYVNLLIYGVALAGLVAVIPWLIRVGRNRNRLAGALAAAGIAGTFIVSSHYWTYRDRVREVSQEVARKSGREVEAVQREITAALPFTRFLELRAKAGWSLGRRSADGPTVNGAIVWIVWAVEALGLLVVAVGLAIERHPYCEGCGRWMTVSPLFESPAPSTQTVAQIAGASEPAALWAPLPDANLIAPREALSYAAHRCDGCARPWFVTIVHRWQRALAGGGVEPKETVLHGMVEVPNEIARPHVDAFVEHARRRGVRLPPV